MTVTVVVVVTEKLVTVNVAEVLPAGTLTEPGTWTTVVLLLESDTVAPPDGAAPLNETVAVELLPPVTVVGLSVTAVITGGLIVSVAFALTP